MGLRHARGDFNFFPLPPELWDPLSAILKENTDKSHFIDLGAADNLVSVMASQLGYEKITSYEINKLLAQMGEQNIKDHLAAGTTIDQVVNDLFFLIPRHRGSVFYINMWTPNSTLDQEQKNSFWLHMVIMPLFSVKRSAIGIIVVTNAGYKVYEKLIPALGLTMQHVGSAKITISGRRECNVVDMHLIVVSDLDNL